MPPASPATPPASPATPPASPWQQLLFIGWFAAAVLGGSLLVWGGAILIPFALAVMIWYLINALAQVLARLIPGRAPQWLALTAALACVFAALYAAGLMVAANAAGVSDALPGYARNLERLSTGIGSRLGLDDAFNIGEFIGGINFTPYLQSVVGGIANAAGIAVLIVIYVFFLLIEQNSFNAKMDAIFPDPPRRAAARAIMAATQARIRTYVWIKTLMSLLTAAASYLVLLLVGLDFAVFWAFLIFLLNYVPTIGSLLAVVFPVLLALVQFESISPAITVAAGCAMAQILIGNVLEPRLMGNSLNVSPLVVILGLALWGAIWGIPGMFLSVPITVMLMIVFAHFPATRPIAILLSGNGSMNLPDTEDGTEAR